MRRTSPVRLSCGVKQGRIEERGVALGSGNCTRWLSKYSANSGRPSPDSRADRLREWQIQRRPGLERHVAMGDGALQRQHRRKTLDMDWKALDGRRRLEAEMVVAMRHLGSPAGIDDVELRRDLIAGPSHASLASAMIALP